MSFLNAFDAKKNSATFDLNFFVVFTASHIGNLLQACHQGAQEMDDTRRGGIQNHQHLYIISKF
jgi:hypothetical protein